MISMNKKHNNIISILLACTLHIALFASLIFVYETSNANIPNRPLMLKASLIKEGNDASVITYGAGVHWALDTLKDLEYVSVDLIDLRSLAPLDTETIYNSVNKTGKVMILQEDSMFGGIASDIAAMIMENCFEKLDAPVKRLASIDTPIPFASNLEANYLPKNKFQNDLLELLAY